MHAKTAFGRMLFIGLAAMMMAGTACAENLLWKATSDQGTFYLLGSVHLLRESDYPLDPAIERAYVQCDALVMEVDMAAMASLEAQQQIIEKAMLSDGKTLADELDTETHAMLSKALKAAGISPDTYAPFKPWFVAAALEIKYMQKLGFDPKLGLEHYFHAKAIEDKKEQVGLESVDFQINLFDSLSKDNANHYIQHALAELGQMESMTDKMMSAWKEGDAAALDKLIRETFADYPGMYERFVSDRNKAWRKKLLDMTEKDKTYLVVVGAAHLVGEDGLIELIKADGLRIEQL